MTNAFLLLRDLELADFAVERQERVRVRVETQLKTAEFIGSVVELFLPLAADTLTTMAGGEPLSTDTPYLSAATLEAESQRRATDDLSPPPGPMINPDDRVR